MPQVRVKGVVNPMQFPDDMPVEDIKAFLANKFGKKKSLGLRIDGTEKGTGFFGIQKAAGGRDMTELTIGVDFGKGEIEIPSLVPTLTKEELEFLKAGNDVTEEIQEKAIQHAELRFRQGKSQFIEKGETVTTFTKKKIDINQAKQ